MAVNPEELKGLVKDKDNRKVWENLNLWESIDASDPDEEDYDQLAGPADLSLSSTSTINPSRPRTWAAGYQPDEGGEYGVLTVVFRDDSGGSGVWWNYYDVPQGIWESFKSAESKGRYLESSGLNNWDKMGRSDMRSLGGFRRGTLNAIIRGARNYQESSGGQQRERLYTASGRKKTTWNSLGNKE